MLRSWWRSHLMRLGSQRSEPDAPLWTPEDSSDSLGSVRATGVAPAGPVLITLRVTKGARQAVRS